MKKSLKTGLLGIALGFVAAMASATVGGVETAARPCCSVCDNQYNYCVNGCGGNPSCIDSCDAQWDNCSVTCSQSC